MAKKHSILSRVAFHKKRCADTRVSEGKRLYSYYWLNGYNDTHAKRNLSAAQLERENKREMGLLSRDESIKLNAHINGLKARIDSD